MLFNILIDTIRYSLKKYQFMYIKKLLVSTDPLNLNFVKFNNH